VNDTDKIIMLLERIAAALESGTPRRKRAAATAAQPLARDPHNRPAIESFVRAWNRTCGGRLPNATMPEPGTIRWARIVECLGVEPSHDVWSAAFDALCRSAWHTGNNERGWRANIDFVIQPSQRNKWLEEGAFKISRAQAKPESKIVFCVGCEGPAVFGPGTRAPEMSVDPKCEECHK
jgi:hypothetical protein